MSAPTSNVSSSRLDPLNFVFETVTTGAPLYSSRGVYPNPAQVSFYDSARLVQLSWAVYNPSGNLLSKNCYSNVSFTEIYTDLTAALDKCKTLVAHNLDSHIKIIQAEMFRAQLPDCFFGIKPECTMKMASPPAPGISLEDLYLKTFGTPPDPSLDHIDMCSQIYFKLRI